MAVLGFLRRAIGRLFRWPAAATVATKALQRQAAAQAIQKDRAPGEPIGTPRRRLASPLVTTSVRPPGRRMPPAAARAISRPLRQFAGRGGRRGPPPLPTGFSIDDLSDWQEVSSSWIGALRFVPLATKIPPGEPITNPRALTGYVDMRVANTKYPIYRYGPGVRWGQFDRWLAAASKGKHWWRVWTAKWSPAKKI